MGVENEVTTWIVLANAFVAYHHKAKLPLRADGIEKRLLGSLVTLHSGVKPKGMMPKEISRLRECLEHGIGMANRLEFYGPDALA